MVEIEYPSGDWSVEITPAQLSAGVAAAQEHSESHYKVWVALRDAGVPVRNDGGRPIASLAATAIRTRMAEGLSL